MDELDYLDRDRRSAETLFQVLAEREGKSSIKVASNEAFTGWSRTRNTRVSPILGDLSDRSADSSQRCSQAPAEGDVGLRSSHCPNVRRGGRTTTRPWAF
ncbi:ATP-binding protein [Streptomyces olivochromogenes]|uniref:ATP-binding protein n=1 Tax=Streptomyces olivochromogenes TaxID=1963 RepID=UPI00368F318F